MPTQVRKALTNLRPNKDTIHRPGYDTTNNIFYIDHPELFRITSHQVGERQFDLFRHLAGNNFLMNNQIASRLVNWVVHNMSVEKRRQGVEVSPLCQFGAEMAFGLGQQPFLHRGWESHAVSKHAIKGVGFVVAELLSWGSGRWRCQSLSQVCTPQ